MKLNNMLPESSKISMTFGLIDVVVVPIGSGAMLSGGAECAAGMERSAAARAASRVRRWKKFMLCMISSWLGLVQHCLHIAHGIARTAYAHRDPIERGAACLDRAAAAVLHGLASPGVRTAAGRERGAHALHRFRCARGVAKAVDDVLHPVSGRIHAEVHRAVARI